MVNISLSFTISVCNIIYSIYYYSLLVQYIIIINYKGKKAMISSLRTNMMYTAHMRHVSKQHVGIAGIACGKKIKKTIQSVNYDMFNV